MPEHAPKLHFSSRESRVKRFLGPKTLTFAAICLIGAISTRIIYNDLLHDQAIYGQPAELSDTGEPVIRKGRVDFNAIVYNETIDRPDYSIGRAGDLPEVEMIEVYGHTYRSFQPELGKKDVTFKDSVKTVGRWFKVKLNDGTPGFLKGDSVKLLPKETPK